MLEPVVVVLGTVTVLGTVSRRFNLLEPAVLLVGGLLIGLLPLADHIELSPELILTIVLPALLYWESLTTSLREVRANLRVIILLAVGLVLFTTPVVAAGLHYIEGTDWTTAFVIGAVLAPTDAAAVAVIAGLLPRRFMTMLRAESLINDGTALVLVAAAVEVVVSGNDDVRWDQLLVDLLLSYAGGIAIGVIVAIVVLGVRKHLQDPLMASVLSILTPFAAFFPAEEAHVSGVLAVVVCGLVLARYSPRLIPSESRLRIYSFWGLSTYVLNASLFVLVGVELPDAAKALESRTVAHGVAAVVIATLAVMIARIVWSFALTVVIRTLDRRASQRARRVSTRHRIPTAWAGVRGGISLAAALSVPVVTDAGVPFADRDFIIFVAGGTVLLSLLVQGTTLPAVIRWARYPSDGSAAEEHHRARQEMTRAALQHLDHADVDGDDRKVVRAVRQGYERQDALLAMEDESATQEAMDRETDLRLSAVRAQHLRLIEMRDRDEIDGTVFLGLEAALDTEERNLHLNRASRIENALE